ncbi:hypothetical protein AX15_003273 [Amanita polypyramis BW_CC]|nr:hypothetical protein AX15_003273 [Amanita polypyramis BW_CC]
MPLKITFPPLHAVIILTNGTVPRLGVATDYTLTTLSSIFPQSLARNIGIIFSNVASPLSWNFDKDSLPDILKCNARQFLLDNPLAMWKKYAALRSQKSMNKRLLAKMEGAIREGHLRALNEMTSLFDWLDTLIPQPTIDIADLYEQFQAIERSIGNALSRATQVAKKREKI